MRRYALLSAVCLAAMPVAGHHSDAGMDVDSIVAFEGSVTDFAFRNPHAYVLVETTAANGDAVEWSLQMGGVNGLARRGWSADTLTAGDRVAVRVHPAEDGRPYGLVESIEKEGGLGLTPAAGAPDRPADAAATSLSGKWRADRSMLISYPGGFDGFFHAQLKLTDQGAAAQAAYDPLVIDTANFTDHRSPYQIGVPSGPHKHVVERYRLIENGTRMAAEFTLEDHEYIAEPLVHSRELVFSPHEEMFRHNCDPEAASRFVR